MMILTEGGAPGTARYEYRPDAFRVRLGAHPAPARLLPLVDYVRNAQPELFVEGVPSKNGSVIVPSHVVTGSLRRGRSSLLLPWWEHAG